MVDFKVTLVTESDRSSVAEHLSKAFLLNEPTLSYMGVGADPSLLKMFVDLIDHGISLKAVNECGEIVGVFLSEVIDKVIILQSNRYFAEFSFSIVCVLI